MRDIGYSLESALADVIDNSITAGSTVVDLFADTSGPESAIAILDNGCGMTPDELVDAMRPGSRSPVEERHASDLGRFGLGLKTASFSQCRRLTVVTRRGGVTSAAAWDLDRVAEVDDWLIEIPDDANSIRWVDRLPDTGTLVLWEKLDRLVPSEWSDAAQAAFVKRIADARTHLELVFHRFLVSEAGHRKIGMSLNGRPLVPFDPFHMGHAATLVGPVERIRVGVQEVVVQPFTLPHRQKVKPAEWNRYAGPEGYLRNQGFYVYRGRRLIIYGTWFGMARQMELTKLARVRIEMPNGLDAAWKIDVKKSSAQPPYQVKERLRRIIEKLGATSKRVYTARGKRLVDENRVPVWSRVQNKNEITYSINEDHPMLLDFTSRLPEEMKPEFLRVLEVAGASLPIDALYADFGGESDLVAGNATSDEALRSAIESTFNHLVAANFTPSDVETILRVAEPFRSNWVRSEVILRQISRIGGTDG